MNEMPTMFSKTMAEAQRTIGKIEAQVRKVAVGSFEKIRTHKTIHKVETTLTTLRSKYLDKAIEQMDLTPIRKRVEQARTRIGTKAYEAIGLATKADIRSITTKVEKLRMELKKLMGQNKKAPTSQA